MSLVDALPERLTEAPAHELRRATIAVRVSFTWFGTRKAVSTAQRDLMAQGFDAEGTSISAGKKLVNTKHPDFKRLTKVKGAISAYWKGISLPYPEDGIRLIKSECLDDFETEMAALRDDLGMAVAALAEHYEDIRLEAKARLGSLFDPGDYPATLDGLFAVSWDYPSVEPPDYLLELKPALYEQERQRMAARFEEAVRLAEQSFATEFSKVVAALCESLDGRRANGETKELKQSAIRSTMEFFDRFKSLRIGNASQLDALVEQAQLAIQGTNAKALREDGDTRVSIAGQLAAVRDQLETMVVDRPRRRILRPTPVAAQEPARDSDD